MVSGSARPGSAGHRVLGSVCPKSDRERKLRPENGGVHRGTPARYKGQGKGARGALGRTGADPEGTGLERASWGEALGRTGAEESLLGEMAGCTGACLRCRSRIVPRAHAHSARCDAAAPRPSRAVPERVNRPGPSKGSPKGRLPPSPRDQLKHEVLWYLVHSPMTRPIPLILWLAVGHSVSAVPLQGPFATTILLFPKSASRLIEEASVPHLLQGVEGGDAGDFSRCCTSEHGFWTCRPSETFAWRECTSLQHGAGSIQLVGRFFMACKVNASWRELPPHRPLSSRGPFLFEGSNDQGMCSEKQRRSAISWPSGTKRLPSVSLAQARSEVLSVVPGYRRKAQLGQ